VDTELAYIQSGQEALSESAQHKVKVSEPAADLAGSISSFAAQARSMALKEGTERFKLADPAGLIGRFEATVQKWQRLVDGVDRKDAAALKNLLRTQVYDKVDTAKYGQ
jgi:predicted lipid-binding transport protein (Tim44 family)